ncbi:ABC transporter permease [Stackebrandtia nassauensis]|uniref:ABC-type Na+ efflux pump permease component-like protein n=1 Tax=Stackebrandtia nassauensis (strain DSM 44728 / CIP 108903 / NRRL B-16338 / NBRC 102104 / LLR-40K-21) TaxID=446470 RepID=D3Q5Z7_STANL|nr:ABC transporter permease [Stackebrandtia nassauensis]ADD40296.1 ABC-type Na+ efflux pump permease component- like protein [Stackebrandtia nassauensis DSM 44728]
MKGLWLVARREILVRGKSKSYLIGLLASAVLVVVVSLLPTFLGGDDTYKIAVTGTDAPVLAESVPEVGEAHGMKIEADEVDDAAAAKAAISDDKADIAIVDNKTVIADGEPDQGLLTVVEAVHQRVIAERQLVDAGADPDKVSDAMKVDTLKTEQVNGEDNTARQVIGYFLTIILFFMVMMPTMYVAMGVVEEKSSRIVEILLSSLRTWQLLGGKILGLGVLGFLNLAVPAGVGLIAATATGAIDYLPSGMGVTIVTALGWWVLGFAFYAAMAGSLGSLVSRQEDINSAIGPMTMLMVASYVVTSIYVWDPTATVSKVLSFIPPFSMLMMPVRAAVNDAAPWEQLLSAAVLAAAAVGMLSIGATIYKRSVMRIGSKVKLTEIFTKSA